MLPGLAELSEGSEDSDGIEGRDEADGIEGMEGAESEGMDGADMLPMGLENWARAGDASVRAARPAKAVRVAIFMDWLLVPNVVSLYQRVL